MIIGLSGKKRSGKDAAARFLVYNKGFTRDAFADPIKTMLYELNPMVNTLGRRLKDEVTMYGWESAKENPEVRQLLQRLGTEAGRGYDEDLWVDLLAKRIAGLTDVVITDVRFPNEAEFVESQGVLLRIVRPELSHIVDNHASETVLDDWPFENVLLNDGSLEELYLKVQQFLVD